MKRYNNTERVISVDLKEIRVPDKKIPLLNAMGIAEVEDLLTHYPYRYD